MTLAVISSKTVTAIALAGSVTSDQLAIKTAEKPNPE
jgi:hypothetical protein